MPLTVKTCFEIFNRDVVNIDTTKSKQAKVSRDWLVGVIHQKCDVGILPSSYAVRDIKYGSFARKTKVQPLDDIDLMVCYKGQGASYTGTNLENVYDIEMPDNVIVLSNLRNDNGTLNSRKVVENLKAGLINVPQYKKAEIHRNQEAVTLNLTSYEWNFDIVPCFHTVNGFYLIPDGNGKWKPTDPRIDKNRLESANRDVKMVEQLIRTMKYWKNRVWGKQLSSYAFEQLVLGIVENMELYSIQRNVWVILSQLSSEIKSTIPDPKGYQGDLNTLTVDERRTFAKTAERHASWANEAYAAEFLYGNHRDAIGKWRMVFGNNFPQFG